LFEKPLRVGVTTVSAVAVVAALVALALGSGQAEPSVAAKAPKVDGHGFPRTLSFWKCGNDPAIAKRDMSVGYAACPDPAVLRRLNPKGIFLLTPGLFPKNLNEYGGMHVTYGQGLWYWRHGIAWKNGGCDTAPGPVNLGCIREFDLDWDYLWNANGTLAGINNGTDGHRGWNLVDPTGKGTRELVAKFFAYTAKVDGLYTKPWDGVFSDNWTYSALGQGWAYGPNIDANRDGKVDNQATLRRGWNDGLNEVGNRIRSYLPGKTVAGNGSWFPMWLGYNGTDRLGWLKASNATMVDDLQDWYNNGAGGPPKLLQIASRWLAFKDPSGLPRYVLFREKALTNSGALLNIPSNGNPNNPKYLLNPGVMRSMRWGLTLALMGGAYYEIVVQRWDSTLWWYDEYDGGKGIRRRGYLGQALGPPVRLGAGRVWRRNFQKGIALNNSTSKAVRINLKRPFRHLRGPQNPHLNNGRIVTSVTLKGHDGLILLNVKR